MIASIQPLGVIAYLGAVGVSLLAIYGVASIISGGGRWKENYEAERVKAERYETQRDAAQDERDRLQAVVELMGGVRVYEAIEAHEERAEARAFNLEKRAEERHEALIGLFKATGITLAELNHDGKQLRKE